MKDVVGVAWYEDETAYVSALRVFNDAEDMPDSFQEWKALVEKQCQLIRSSGKTPLRADIVPESFGAWCASRGFPTNAAGRISFVDHVVLEYQKTGRGRFVE